MFLLLVAASAVYLVVGDVHEALVLAASIVVVVAITVAQERKAERALDALRELSSPRALRQPNSAFWWIAAGALAALAAALYAPPLAAIFRFAPLGAGELAVAAGAGIAGVGWYDLWKMLSGSRRSGPAPGPRY